MSVIEFMHFPLHADRVVRTRRGIVNKIKNSYCRRVHRVRGVRGVDGMGFLELFYDYVQIFTVSDDLTLCLIKIYAI